MSLFKKEPMCGHFDCFLYKYAFNTINGTNANRKGKASSHHSNMNKKDNLKSTCGICSNIKFRNLDIAKKPLYMLWLQHIPEYRITNWKWRET